MDNPRDTILDLLSGHRRVRVGLREVNIWPETLAVWLEQGYPAAEAPREDGSIHRQPVDWVSHFHYDMARAGGNIDFLPHLGVREVVEETDEWLIIRDGSGAALKTWKGRSGTPEHVDFAMTSRTVWERDYRPALLGVDRRRIDIEGTRRLLALRRAQGLYTYYQSQFIWENMRHMLGDLCLYESLALDPAWIHDIGRVHTDLYKAHYRILFEEVGLPDGVRLCEDLGYKNGLFLSPRMLEELILPYYKELVDFFHGYGLQVELHSCGDVTEGVPLIVQAGFDILNPLEIKAGCDPLRLAEMYGDRLAFIGGLDVRVLESGDRQIIRREVGRLLEGMKARGARFVFGSDHSLTPRIAYADYLYAIEVYREHMSY